MNIFLPSIRSSTPFFSPCRASVTVRKENVSTPQTLYSQTTEKALSGVQDVSKLHLTETKPWELHLSHPRSITDELLWGGDLRMEAPLLLMFSGPLFLCSEWNLFAVGVLWQHTTFLLEKKKKVRGNEWTAAYRCLSILDASKTVMSRPDFVWTKLCWTWPKSESQVQQHSQKCLQV